MQRFALPFVAAISVALAACSPSLDWREFQPEGSGVIVTFPCKPDRFVRSVQLEVQVARLEMLTCSAGGMHFALSFLDAAEPANVPVALAELRTLVARNLGATGGGEVPITVPGMTPNPQAVRVQLEGHAPDGAVMQEQAAFFAKGLRVFQAVVLGRHVSAEAADAFLGGLRLPS